MDGCGGAAPTVGPMEAFRAASCARNCACCCLARSRRSRRAYSALDDAGWNGSACEVGPGMGAPAVGGAAPLAGGVATWAGSGADQTDSRLVDGAATCASGAVDDPVSLGVDAVAGCGHGEVHASPGGAAAP